MLGYVSRRDDIGHHVDAAVPHFGRRQHPPDPLGSVHAVHERQHDGMRTDAGQQLPDSALDVVRLGTIEHVVHLSDFRRRIGRRFRPGREAALLRVDQQPPLAYVPQRLPPRNEIDLRLVGMFVETGQQSAQKPADTARADDRYSRFHRPDRIWFYDAKIAKRTSARHPGAKKNIGFLAAGLPQESRCCTGNGVIGRPDCLGRIFRPYVSRLSSAHDCTPTCPTERTRTSGSPTGDPVDEIAHREHLRNAPPVGLEPLSQRVQLAVDAHPLDSQVGVRAYLSVANPVIHHRSTYRPDRTSSG